MADVVLKRHCKLLSFFTIIFAKIRVTVNAFDRRNERRRALSLRKLSFVVVVVVVVVGPSSLVVVG